MKQRTTPKPNNHRIRGQEEDSSMFIPTTGDKVLQETSNHTVNKDTRDLKNEMNRDISQGSDPEFEAIFREWCNDGSLEPIPLAEYFEQEFDFDMELLENI